MIKCEICNTDINSIKVLRRHITLNHSDVITPEEYYCKYIGTVGICQTCNKPTKFISFTAGYRKFCTNKCIGINNNIKKQKTETLLTNFGVTHQMQSDVIKDKIKKTNIERYGVDNVLKLDAIKDKIKKTNIDRYGSVTPLHENNIIKDKVIKTNIERYGTEHAIQSVSVNEKKKRTNISRYGTEHYCSTVEFRNKVKITNNKKYNSNWYISSDTFKDLMVSKYNLILNENNLSIYDDYTVKDKIYKIKCNECNLIFDRCVNIATVKTIQCPSCKLGSSIENKIKKLLISNDISYTMNDRSIISPYELDFYLPDYNIAIECHGLYWHSEQILIIRGQNPKKYHLLKYELCNDKGIQLLQFFEDEINNNFEIVKNIILAKCHKLKKLCGARECKITETTHTETSNLLATNHLNGINYGNKYFIGAYYKNELVAIMTFKKGSIDKSNIDTIELDRFCTINGYYIPGIASKLFKYFIKNNDIDSVITYADLRFSNGDLYNNLGFNLLYKSEPSLFYIKNDKRYHRFNFAKYKLQSKFKNFDNTLTEYQNMINNKFDRIWDCGKLKFEYTNTYLIKTLKGE